MKRNSTKLLTAAILLACAQQAFAAAGTTAGTTVANSATVNYTVGTTPQTQQTGTADFLIDRLLDVTVAESGGAYTSVSPGATSQAVLFTVTNGTNDQMDIGLSALNVGTDPHNSDAADDFDVSNFSYYVDDGDGVFEPGADDGAAVTFLDERTPDQVTKVWVVADVPASQPDGDISAVGLVATLHDSTASDGDPDTPLPLGSFEAPDGLDGAVATEDSGANTNNAVQNVFADVAGDVAGDGARDGKHSDRDAYKVAAATIAVAKTATVLDDPVNITTNPKAIPGATVEYCITVTNTGGTAATAVSVDDPIPAGTTYVNESIKVGTSCDYGTASSEDDNATDADDADSVTGSKDGTGVHTEVDTLGASGSVTATLFHVTVD